MSVILRCPHCGTARATPGGCDACHEASVRYFCTNHTPGIWVDAPACPRCGARFGEEPRRPAPPPPAPTTPRSTPPKRVAPADPWSAPSEPRDEWEARERMPPADEVRVPARYSPLAHWLEMIGAASRTRRAAPPEVRVPGAGMARGVFGCLVQILVLVVSLLLGGVFLVGW